MNRQPQRLADILPGVVADLANRHHATNGEPPPVTAPPAVSSAPAVSRPTSRKPFARPGAPLSKLERRVLVLIAEGLSDREIAEKVGVQLTTQKTLAKRIYAKLRVDTRQAAVNQAWIKGLLGPNPVHVPADAGADLRLLGDLLQKHGGPDHWTAFASICARLKAGDRAQLLVDEMETPPPSWLHVAGAGQ